MKDLVIRGARQWSTALKDPESVEGLDLHGPASFSLEGIERMTNLRRVWFLDGSPTDQLHRLKGLRDLASLWVHLGDSPHDLASLVDCRIAALEPHAFDTRRGLELVDLPYHRIEGLTSLRLSVHAPAMIPWDCSWLTEAPGLRQLWVRGVYAWPDDAEAALRSARQLQSLVWHPNRGGDYLEELRLQDSGYFSDWQAEMQAALPDTRIHPAEWLPQVPQVDARWAVTELDGGRARRATLGPEQLADLVVAVRDAASLRRMLERWNPILEQRVSIESDGDALRIEARMSDDIGFIQELLTFGTPDDPDPGDTPSLVGLDAALERFVNAFVAEVRAGRLPDDAIAAQRWVQGMTELQESGVEGLEDTVTREQLVEVLQEPLAEAGLDAESVVLAF